MGQRVKRLPAMRETKVRSLGWEDPLEKEMATHSSILAWRISWIEEPGGLQSMGLQRVGHDWVTSLHFCMKYLMHGISNFLEEISSLSHSIVFLYFFVLNTKEAFCISACHSWNSAFKWIYLSFSLCLWLLFSQLFVRPPQTTILPICIYFSWGWYWSQPTVESHPPPSIVFQALCLSDLMPWIYFSLPLYNCKGFDLGHTWMVKWFSLLSSI